MEELLKQAEKVAEEAEVFAVSRSETDAVFETNRLKQVVTRETSGKALRLIKKGRIGFSASNRVDGAKELVNMALEMAPFGAEAKFEFPSLEAYTKVEVYDHKIEKVTAEQMVELGQSLIDRIRAHSPEIICQGGVSRNTISVEILNSRGGHATYKKSVFSLSVEGVLIRGTDMLFVGDSESSCRPISDINTVAAHTIEQLERAKEIAPSPEGRLPVIFTPLGVASTLMMPIAMGINGKTVLQGASPLGHRKGEQVFDRRLTIRDDPLMQYRPASRFCDDEGVPSQRTLLIEKGVVANFIYDLQTAALAGTKSTGNGSRSLASLPTPSLSAVVIEEGDTSFEDMVADIKDGLVVEELMGAIMGNVLGGDFSGNVLLGYRVKDGKLAGRVKDTMVSGNIYEALKDVAAIGNKARWVGGMVLTPHIYCPRLAVSAKK
ncbi:MAG: TldD/PmbA family protein [Chloroflexi bacterium]|nr:TldD/PmbA family protein [Chloroflexota bacterium]